MADVTAALNIVSDVRDVVCVLASLSESTGDKYTSRGLCFVIDGLGTYADSMEKVLLELDKEKPPQVQAEQCAEHGGGSE